MNREQVIDAIANLERELQDTSAQDSLVVLHRQLQGLVASAKRLNLPIARPLDLLAQIESRMNGESLERARNGVPPAEPADRPTVSQPAPEPRPAPCEHPNKSFNEDGVPVCNDCGYAFQPAPMKPTIDRKAAIDDLFGKG